MVLVGLNLTIQQGISSFHIILQWTVAIEYFV